jgi:hypothetical protein
MQPWIKCPNTLVNWWDMEKFAAENFVNIGSQLVGMSGQLNKLLPFETVNLPNRLQTAAKLRTLIDTCNGISLRVAAGHIGQVIRNLETPDAQFIGTQISQMLISIGMNLCSEMETHLFMRVFPERAEFYERNDLFGSTVANNFPNATRDIREAGNCYACDRNTACVMHLMRVLEVGLSVFSVQLNASSTRKFWENIINDIEVEIKKINGPHAGADWKERQQFYSGAAKDFRYFKDAWRNHAMHYREHYEAAEAKSILDHVKAFMVQLAEGGLKE